MMIYLALFSILACISKTSYAQAYAKELAYLNATKLIQQKTIEQIYRSKCTVVHHSLDETFNGTTDVLNFLSNDENLGNSYIFIEQLAQSCPNGTYISVSQPLQNSMYQSTGRLYVGHETQFEIRGSIDLNGIRDYMGTSSNANLIPEEEPKAAMQVSSS